MFLALYAKHEDIKGDIMRIDSHEVRFSSSHTSFYSTALTDEYFNFQENLSQAKMDEVKGLQRKDSETFSSDFIIHKLTQAILKNLFILRRRMSKSAFKIEVASLEKESLSFKTKAFIKTGGKNIEVDIDVNMQRSFVRKMNLNSVFKGLFVDPLVLSFDDKMPSLSQKKFSFDIDSDGRSDQISLLSKNCAFLALDKNKNGYIDSANELFGAKSGNGFEDLKLYDEDDNGWIDENDAIFDKLRVWKKSEDEDRLLALGEVGIGAIYLGNTHTDFALNNVDTNESLGKMRRSGFFLKDNGESGVISQIDFALKQKDGETQKNILKTLLGGFKTSIPSFKEEKSLFSILEEYIKQLEVELIKATGSKQISIKEKILRAKEKIQELRA